MLLRAFSILMLVAGPSVFANPAAVDLSSVRSLYIEADTSPERFAAIMKTVGDIVPVRMTDRPEDADLIAEYSDDASGAWSARLYRLDCQSLDFNERPVHGPCERNVFVRINLGTLRRTIVHGRSSDEELAFGLRDAILGIEPQPPEPEPQLKEVVPPPLPDLGTIQTAPAPDVTFIEDAIPR